MNFVIILLLAIGFTFGDDYDYDYDTDINPQNVGSQTICTPPRICVKHYQCFENGTLKLNGENIISFKYRSEDIKLSWKQNSLLTESLDVAKETKCNLLERCCLNNETPSPPPSPSSLPPTRLLPPMPTNNFEFRYKGCGYKNENSRLVPWIVTLLKKNQITNQSKFLCGGSLIHNRVVLTAAHCVRQIKKTDYIVRTGDLPSQERNIIDIKIHDYFIASKLHHDIAIVIVDHGFEFNINVQPICLGEISLRSNSGAACDAITWGKGEFKRLQSVQVHVVPAPECQKQLRRTRLSYGFDLHRSSMCATPFDERVTCDTDGGLSLVCPIADEPNRYYQSGIVSWGMIGTDKYPDVYTDVAVHRVWINREMKTKNFGIDSFSY